MNQPTPAAVKKIQTLAQIAADLRKGRDFNITRLTILKGFCSDPDAAAQFALHIAKLAQQRFKFRHAKTKAEKWENIGRLIAGAVQAMTRYLKAPTEEAKSELRDRFAQARNAQNRYEHQRWADVRIVECWELLIVETAMGCVLSPWNSSLLGYQIARQYAEKYDSRYGSGLIPESAPMIEEMAKFWGKYYLGRGWRKKVGIKDK